MRCVEAFLEQSIKDHPTPPDGLRGAGIEILVIENHSQDDSIGVLRNRLDGCENVRIIETPGNSGFGYGYNTAARYASGEYLLINNPAKILPSDGVERLVSKMQSDTSIGILAPKLVHGDGTVRTSARSFPHPFDVVVKRTFLRNLFPGRVRRYLQLDADPDLERTVDWVVGGCFMMRRDFFLKLRGFDERFFLFFEDTDLCRRCEKAGKSVVYYPSVQGTDRKSRLSEGGLWALLLTRIGRAHIRSGLRYFGKWGWGT